ncbi:cytochrome c [Novosphingobium sp. KACC 22771]|uniref:cytochrome c n=1 Tax=Novosphingobium sp. KACC 22771 TaxID=3025670 RepID=UPI002365CA05|nr:cytochrome c [Novosphingobium sp. KACC 22771]WDF74994.1 cytochrome c [Novosphingobium sp. KACC 22771]
MKGENRLIRLGTMALPAALIVLAVSACGERKDAGQAQPGELAAATPFLPIVSVKELMDSTVDPAADGVWDAVGTVSSAKGVDHHQPRNAEEWQAVRRHAVTLAEAMNAVMIDGRHAAPADTKAGLGEQEPAQIDAAIKANPAQFNQFATATRDVAVDIIAAIDRKDTAALMRLGGTLDDRCEACHVTYWYPNSPRPKT